ncbi:hypothetical protein FB451DRAFT_514196 [Mycena latifolia]|nr:hypothetical protein FB451DRAFT_514196 [Mycena latifolia]
MHPTRLRFVNSANPRTSGRNSQPSSWIAFGIYLFVQFGGSRSAVIPMVRRSALVDSSESEPSSLAVLPGQATAVSGSPAVSLDTTTKGKLTTVTGPSVPSVPVRPPHIIIGRSTTSSSVNPNIVGASIGATILILGLALGYCVMLRMRTASLRAKISGRKPAKSADEISRIKSSEQTETVPDTEFHAANRASWELYIPEIQSPQHALTHSNTISTQRLYISNQAKRARQKELEIYRGHASVHLAGESPKDNENPFESNLDRTRASWKTFSSEDTLAAPSTVSTRQLYIPNQAEREAMPAVLRSSPQSSRASSAALSSWTYQDSRHSAADTELANSSEVQDKLDRAIHQIEALSARICELESQRGPS